MAPIKHARTPTLDIAYEDSGPAGGTPVFLMHGGTGEDFYRIVVDQFDALYEDWKRIPRVMSISSSLRAASREMFQHHSPNTDLIRREFRPHGPSQVTASGNVPGESA